MPAKTAKNELSMIAPFLAARLCSSNNVEGNSLESDLTFANNGA